MEDADMIYLAKYRQPFNPECVLYESEYMNGLLRKPFLEKNKVLIFAGIWLLVNLLQAAFTGLANDEAYYWMYARKLSIGYFDHPPMIAVMIRLGDWLMHSELGLRLLTVLFSTLLIPVMYRLTNRKDFSLFVLLICSATVFQVYGFIAVPDAPLMLFTGLFFLAYKNYAERNGVKEALLLIVVIALLLYSKYHGFLVLIFTLLSNFSLLKRKSFYAVIAGVIVLYAPHIWWQIANDYPSYQYHVLNKSQTSYNPLDSLAFLAGVLLVAGPLTGCMMIYATFRHRPKDAAIKAMRFTFFGFTIFFFASAFNAAVEPNWMAASIVPLVVIAHHYFSEKENARKWLVRLAFISLLIFSFARINLMTDFVPALGSKILPEFYGWREWAAAIEKHAEGKPVVIMNSYQKASKYSFYTNTEALSLNNVCYRRNQYDLWDIADNMQGKDVALFMTWAEGRDSLKTFDTPCGKMQELFIDNFHSYTKVRIETGKDWYHFKPGTDVEIPLTVYSTAPGGTLDFFQDAQYPVSLVYERYYFQQFEQEIKRQEIDQPSLGNEWKPVAHLHTPDKAGPYYLRFCIKTGWMPAYINSHLIRMDVED